VPSIGRPLAPLESLRGIRCASDTVEQEDGGFVLGLGQTVLGCLDEPVQRFLVVLRDSFAAEEHHRHAILRASMSSRCRLEQQAECGNRVFPDAIPLIQPQPLLGSLFDGWIESANSRGGTCLETVASGALP